MTYNEKDEDLYFDMLEAFDEIQSRVRDRAEFDADKMARVWCLHHLIVATEAGARLTPEGRSLAPAIPWPALIGMRNVIADAGFRADWEEVWATVEHDLPPLREKVASVVETIKSRYR